MKTYRIVALPGAESDAQNRGWDGHHAPGGFTIYAFARSPAFVGIVAQELYEVMRERKVGGAAGGLALVLVFALFQFLIHAPFLVSLGVALLAAFAAFRFTGNYDSVALEQKSHAVTYLLSMSADSLLPAVAMARVLNSLKTYHGHKGTDVELTSAVLAACPAAQAWINANPEVVAEAKALKQPAWKE